MEYCHFVMMCASHMMYLRYDAMSVSFMRVSAHHLRSRHHCSSNIIRERSETDIIKKPPMQSIGGFFWRRHPDLNRGIADLQSTALPLGYGAILERATRLELATSTLARWRSTG